jgi:hypothetical protein
MNGDYLNRLFQIDVFLRISFQCIYLLSQLSKTLDNSSKKFLTRYFKGKKECVEG